MTGPSASRPKAAQTLPARERSAQDTPSIPSTLYGRARPGPLPRLVTQAKHRTSAPLPDRFEAETSFRARRPERVGRPGHGPDRRMAPCVPATDANPRWARRRGEQLVRLRARDRGRRRRAEGRRLAAGERAQRESRRLAPLRRPVSPPGTPARITRAARRPQPGTSRAADRRSALGVLAARVDVLSDILGRSRPCRRGG